jgi:hypothetical protein
MSVATSRATIADAVEMATQMRAEDAAEVWTLNRMTPFEALESSLSLSGSQSWTLRRDGKIMAIWGIVDVSLLAGIALPWALTTGEVDRHPRDFLRASREAVRLLRQRYAVSMNRVDARYGKALRWAAKLGFEVQEPKEGYCLITLRGD